MVFAKSEALGLLKAGYTKHKVIAAYCQAMAERVVSLLERICVEEGFFITCGTLGAIKNAAGQGVRPAEQMELILHDPRRGRSIVHRYSVANLQVIA